MGLNDAILSLGLFGKGLNLSMLKEKLVGLAIAGISVSSLIYMVKCLR